MKTLIFEIPQILTATYKLTKHINLSDPKYRTDINSLNELGKAEQDKRTVKLQFDFEGVKSEEVGYFLTSQTTVRKMWYNNVGQNMTDQEVLEQVETGKPIVVMVRELLDTRKSTSLTDEEKSLRDMRKELKKGKTIEQLKAEYEARIKQIELEQSK
jgi:hypothetical protein